MAVEKVETLVVGAGQAGIAMSEHLSSNGLPHLVLERHRIAERWRSERWDSLVANGPAWHDRFPGLEFSDCHPDAFPGKESVADYFVAYADKIAAPVRCGVEVQSARRMEGRSGFRVETSHGVIEAQNIVAATGPFQVPQIPTLVPADAGLHQIHSNDYRNPDQFPDGAVLVIGAGASGVQIADELLRAGKQVHLSVGPHGRYPRSYRARDYCWWLGVLGLWDIPAPEPGTEHISIAVSGAYGGYTVDFRRLAARGMKLVGMTTSFDAGLMRFAPDLADNVARGDADYLAVLDVADAFVARFGVDLPEEPEARIIEPDPLCLTQPVLELDLAEAGITSIVWATGYGVDYRWLEADVFNDQGQPQHQRGVTREPGVYFLGLPWLSRRGSSFIWGVWHDAKYLADQISIQRQYAAYSVSAKRDTQ